MKGGFKAVNAKKFLIFLLVLLIMLAGCTKAPGQKDFDSGMAAEDSEGYIYKLEKSFGHWQVFKFDPKGHLIHPWGNFESPKAIAVNNDTVYVADMDNIKCFTQNGAWKDDWFGFSKPIKIFIISDGVVEVVDKNGARAQRFAGSGKRLGVDE